MKIRHYMMLATMFMLAATAGHLTACSSSDNPATDPADSWRQTLPESIRELTGIEKFQTPIDYAKADNWLNVPATIDKDVDVFFIYPTCYMPANATDPALCDIDNAVMREGAQRMFRIQASVFAESCNIFMPYYRQFSVPELAALGDDGVEEAFRYSASQDPTRALDYYFEHWNEGRPFIIAGHSQGSAITLMLLEDYFREHPDRYERMIAAYPIGYGVTPRDLQRFPHLKFAEGATDTGVIISWNTEGPQNNGHDNVVVKKNGLCINPLNWRLDDTYAPITENLGSFNNNTEQLVPAMADAQLNVSRGVVIVTTEQAANEAAIDASMQQFFGPQCYHGWDYGLFYMNLRQNIADRIVAWQTQHGEIPKAIQDVPGIEKFQTAVDYTDASNWLSLPASTDKAVDLFYLYPTAYTSPDLSAEAIASIDDKGMRSTATTNLSNNGPAFSDYCNVFAPFYRQVDVSYANMQSEEDFNTLTDYVTSQDPTRALDYYFEHLNHGRPFIIAGHSQGSMTTLKLLATYFRQHRELLNRMVAAYPIGYSVTDRYLAANPHLKFAEGADDTGVIVSWNTEGVGNKNAKNLVVESGAISINPLNWRRDATYASVSENHGSRINGQIVEGIADAQLDIERGVVVVTTEAAKPYIIPENMQAIFGPECYHAQDYAFFFVNLKENVARRIEAWKAK